MSREVLERAVTMKALIQAEETVFVRNNIFDTDDSHTIAQPQRDPAFGPPTPVNNDMIWDNGGDDLIFSGAGDDWMIAGRGRDHYDGGRGFDMLAYVRATSGVVVDMGNADGTSFFRDVNGQSFAFGDTMENIEGVVGSRFDDRIRGFSDSRAAHINGFDGNDVITGGRGGDVLRGGKGNDTINGSLGGGDTMFGGDGQDGFTVGADATMTGGSGRDSFVFLMPQFIPGQGGHSMGEIEIMDFGFGGVQDRLIFQGLGQGNQVRLADAGNDVLLTVDGVEGSVRIHDVEISDLFGSFTV